MKHWDTSKRDNVEHPRVDAFLAEIAEICRKHNFSIGHEDGHGAFIVEPLSEWNIDWLMHAHIELDADEEA